MPNVRLFRAVIVADVEASKFVSQEVCDKTHALIVDKLQQALEQIESELSGPGFSVGFIFDEYAD